jgi:hypothetical protein
VRDRLRCLVKWAYGSETPMRPTGFVDPKVQRMSHSHEPMSFMVEMVALEPGDVLLTQTEREELGQPGEVQALKRYISELELALRNARSVLDMTHTCCQHCGKLLPPGQRIVTEQLIMYCNDACRRAAEREDHD